MEIILLLILVLTVGYLTAHFLMDKLKSRYLLAGGLEYMLLGIMMGPVAAGWYSDLFIKLGFQKASSAQPLKLITDVMWESLSPALTLGIGSIGLLVGLRLSFRSTAVPSSSKGSTSQAAVSLEHIQPSILINIVTGLMLGVPTLLGLIWYIDGPSAFITPPDGDLGYAIVHLYKTASLEKIMPLVFWVVATGIVSATRPIEYTVERCGANGPLGRLAIGAAEISAVMGILILGIVFALAHPEQTIFNHTITWVEWMVVQIVIGGMFGGMFTLFIGEEDEPGDKLLVALLGIIVFSTGVAYFLKLSPLFINFFLGLTLANFSRFNEQLLKKLTQIEKPFYIVLYFFAGVAWKPVGAWWVLLGLIAGYFILRWLGRWLGSELAFRFSDDKQTQIQGFRSFGKGLLAQGGISVAMVLNFELIFHSTAQVGTWAHNHAHHHIANGESMDKVQAIFQQGLAFESHDLTSLLSTIILANVLINELLAFRIIRNMLINADEVGEAERDANLPPEDIYARPELEHLDDTYTTPDDIPDVSYSESSNLEEHDN